MGFTGSFWKPWKLRQPSFLLIVVLLVPLGASSRWADIDEADAAIDFERVRYHVKKDGTYRIEVEKQVEILKESARQRMGLMRLRFDSRASRLEFGEAYTLNKKVKSPVRPEHIEVKPLASQGPGFDERSQLTIAYPDVSVGSKLYYRYTREVLKPSLPGVFWTHFSLGWNEYQRKFELSVESEVPVFVEAFDPDKKLQIRGGGTSWKIRLKSPVYRRVVEESNGKMNPKALTWVGITTMKEWTNLPKEIVGRWESVIRSELPKPYTKIVEGAKKMTRRTDQINHVTSKLADLVRYVGDWAPVDGAYFPRPLKLVHETGFGDCKDYSTSTAAMLRQLGFEASVAWVIRDHDLVASPIRLPVMNFNHAIVHARKDGEEFWIDPTNVASFAQGLFSDIADREALILTGDGPRLAKIPPASHEDSETRVEGQLRFVAANKVRVHGEVNFVGADILKMTAMELSYSKASLDYSFLSWITNPHTVLEFKFGPYDLKSRIVKPFKTSFSYSENWLPILTSAGRGYMMGTPAHLAAFQFRRERRVSDLYLGTPHRIHRRYEFSGGDFLLEDKVHCEGSSPWVDFHRQFYRKEDKVFFEEEVILKQSWVPQDEIRSPVFLQLQKRIGECQQAAVLILR